MREAASEGMEGKRKYVERGGNETKYGGREKKLQERRGSRGDMRGHTCYAT